MNTGVVEGVGEGLGLYEQGPLELALLGGPSDAAVGKVISNVCRSTGGVCKSVEMSSKAANPGSCGRSSRCSRSRSKRLSEIGMAAVSCKRRERPQMHLKAYLLCDFKIVILLECGQIWEW